MLPSLEREKIELQSALRGGEMQAEAARRRLAEIDRLETDVPPLDVRFGHAFRVAQAAPLLYDEAVKRLRGECEQRVKKSAQYQAALQAVLVLTSELEDGESSWRRGRTREGIAKELSLAYARFQATTDHVRARENAILEQQFASAKSEWNEKLRESDALWAELQKQNGGAK